ncbi:MAG TPA: DUF2207 domain-containing protein [bacterium]|nr:DUF2207 domain-containing protein [bacterium]
MRYSTLLLLLLGFSAILLAKDYQIQQVDIQADIRPDGTIQFTEERTYTFRGEYYWANYTLGRDEFDGISQITVREGGREYTRSETRQPYTYETTANASELNIKWYFQAADESRTFTLSYRIRGALTSGLRWTEFFWTFISDRWKEETENAGIRITLPDSVDPDSIYLWLRSPDIQARVDKTPNRVSIHGLHIPEDVSLRVRLLFPHKILPNVDVIHSAFTPDVVQRSESAYRRQLRQQEQLSRRRESLGLPLSIAIALIGILVWSGIYYGYGRRNRSDDPVPEILYAPPSGDRPALVGWLLKPGAVTGRHFLATLLDLARRGYLVLRGEQTAQSAARTQPWRFAIRLNPGVRSDTQDKCTEWERALLVCVRERQSDGEVYLDELTDQRTSIRRWFPGWARLVEADARSRNFLEEKSTTAARVNGVIQGLLIVICIGILVWTNSLWILCPMLSGTILLGASRIIRHRTGEAEVLYKQWNALKRAIIRGDSETFPRSAMDELLVHSLTLDVSMKHISVWLRKLDLKPAHIPWLFVHSHSEWAPVEMADVLEALLSTGLQTVSPSPSGAAVQTEHNA